MAPDGGTFLEEKKQLSQQRQARRQKLAGDTRLARHHLFMAEVAGRRDFEERETAGNIGSDPVAIVNRHIVLDALHDSGIPTIARANQVGVVTEFSEETGRHAVRLDNLECLDLQLWDLQNEGTRAIACTPAEEKKRKRAQCATCQLLHSWQRRLRKKAWNTWCLFAESQFWAAQLMQNYLDDLGVQICATAWDKWGVYLEHEVIVGKLVRHWAHAAYYRAFTRWGVYLKRLSWAIQKMKFYLDDFTHRMLLESLSQWKNVAHDEFVSDNITVMATHLERVQLFNAVDQWRTVLRYEVYAAGLMVKWLDNLSRSRFSQVWNKWKAVVNEYSALKWMCAYAEDAIRTSGLIQWKWFVTEHREEQRRGRSKAERALKEALVFTQLRPLETALGMAKRAGLTAETSKSYHKCTKLIGKMRKDIEKQTRLILENKIRGYADNLVQVASMNFAETSVGVDGLSRALAISNDVDILSATIRGESLAAAEAKAADPLRKKGQLTDSAKSLIVLRKERKLAAARRSEELVFRRRVLRAVKLAVSFCDSSKLKGSVEKLHSDQRVVSRVSVSTLRRLIAAAEAVGYDVGTCPELRAAYEALERAVQKAVVFGAGDGFDLGKKYLIWLRDKVVATDRRKDITDVQFSFRASAMSKLEAEGDSVLSVHRIHHSHGSQVLWSGMGQYGQEQGNRPLEMSGTTRVGKAAEKESNPDDFAGYNTLMSLAEGDEEAVAVPAFNRIDMSDVYPPPTAREQVAALTIQAKGRGLCCRLALKRQRAEKEAVAACKLQALLRGGRGRQAFEVKRNEHKIQMGIEEKAAVQLQTVYRGRLSRQRVAQIVYDRSEKRRLAELRAITKLQATYRGSRGRKVTAAILQKHLDQQLQEALHPPMRHVSLRVEPGDLGLELAYRGVCYNAHDQKWHCGLFVGEDFEDLGVFDDEELAWSAYDSAAHDFHVLNFPKLKHHPCAWYRDVSPRILIIASPAALDIPANSFLVAIEGRDISTHTIMDAEALLKASAGRPRKLDFEVMFTHQEKYGLEEQRRSKRREDREHEAHEKADALEREREKRKVVEAEAEEMVEEAQSLPPPPPHSSGVHWAPSAVKTKTLCSNDFYRPLVVEFWNVRNVPDEEQRARDAKQARLAVRAKAKAEHAEQQKLAALAEEMRVMEEKHGKSAAMAKHALEQKRARVRARREADMQKTFDVDDPVEVESKEDDHADFEEGEAPARFATITRVLVSGGYDVELEDGSKEFDVIKSRIRSLDIEEPVELEEEEPPANDAATAPDSTMMHKSEDDEEVVVSSSTGEIIMEFYSRYEPSKATAQNIETILNYFDSPVLLLQLGDMMQSKYLEDPFTNLRVASAAASEAATLAADRASSVAGSAERAAAAAVRSRCIAESEVEWQRKSRSYVVVEVVAPAGPLGIQVKYQAQAPHVTVSAFSSVEGEPGPVETDVHVGAELISVNGVDVSTAANLQDVVLTLLQSADTERKLVFRCQPKLSMKAAKMVAAAAAAATAALAAVSGAHAASAMAASVSASLVASQAASAAAEAVAAAEVLVQKVAEEETEEDVGEIAPKLKGFHVMSVFDMLQDAIKGNCAYPKEKKENRAAPQLKHYVNYTATIPGDAVGPLGVFLAANEALDAAMVLSSEGMAAALDICKGDIVVKVGPVFVLGSDHDTINVLQLLDTMPRPYEVVMARSYQNFFAQFDTDSSGGITPVEFAGAMAEMGFPVPGEVAVQHFFDRFDADGNGLIDFEEFSEFLESQAGDTGTGALDADHREKLLASAMLMRPGADPHQSSSCCFCKVFDVVMHGHQPSGITLALPTDNARDGLFEVISVSVRAQDCGVQAGDLIVNINSIGLEEEAVTLTQATQLLESARPLNFEVARPHANIFREYDAQNDGNVSVDNFNTGLSEMGYGHMQTMSIDHAIRQFDVLNNGTVNVPEFLKNVRLVDQLRGHRAQLRGNQMARVLAAGLLVSPVNFLGQVKKYNANFHHGGADIQFGEDLGGNLIIRKAGPHAQERRIQVGDIVKTMNQVIVQEQELSVADATKIVKQLGALNLELVHTSMNIFQEIDVDNSGLITVDQFCTGLEKMGHEAYTLEAAKYYFSGYEADTDGNISYSRFVSESSSSGYEKPEATAAIGLARLTRENGKSKAARITLVKKSKASMRKRAKERALTKETSSEVGDDVPGTTNDAASLQAIGFGVVANDEVESAPKTRKLDVAVPPGALGLVLEFAGEAPYLRVAGFQSTVVGEPNALEGQVPTGAVLLAVGQADVSQVKDLDAMATILSTDDDLERVLVFEVEEEPHPLDKLQKITVKVPPGPLGLRLAYSSEPEPGESIDQLARFVITAFLDVAGEPGPVEHFVPTGFELHSVNGQDLGAVGTVEEVFELLEGDGERTLVFREPQVSPLHTMRVQVPAGPLGLKIEYSRVAPHFQITNFCPVEGKPGPVESQLVPVGYELISVNGQDVSRAESLGEVADVLTTPGERTLVFRAAPAEFKPEGGGAEEGGGASDGDGAEGGAEKKRKEKKEPRVGPPKPEAADSLNCKLHLEYLVLTRADGGSFFEEWLAEQSVVM
jgi:Ca2+-binding EF-hand superfamily protein